MNNYKDVRKRIIALVLTGLMAATTIGPDLASLAEEPNQCSGYEDRYSYDGDTLIAESGPDGYCDKCGRIEMSHVVIPEVLPEEESEIDEDTTDILEDYSEDAVEDEYLDENIPNEDSIIDGEEIGDEEPQEELPEADLCVHIDENEDGYCDICDELLIEVEEEVEEESNDEVCLHENWKYYGNGDMTHTLFCADCGEEFKEMCQYNGFVSDGYGKHMAVCNLCGLEIYDDCLYDENGICYYCGFDSNEAEEQIVLMRQTFSKTFGDIRVIVSGLIPEGGEVEILSVSTSYAEDKINQVEEDVEVIRAFDINIYDAQGNIYQPEQDGNTVSVTFAGVEELQDNTDVQMVRIEDDNTITDIDSTVYGENVVFEAEHFTIYALTREAAVGYRISQGQIAYIAYTNKITGDDIQFVDGLEFNVYATEAFTLNYTVQVFRDISGYENADGGVKVFEKSYSENVTASAGNNIVCTFNDGDNNNVSRFLVSDDKYAVIIKINNPDKDFTIVSGSGYDEPADLKLGTGIRNRNTGSFSKDYYAQALIKPSLRVDNTPGGVSALTITSQTSTVAQTSPKKIYYLEGDEDKLNVAITPASTLRTKKWSVDSAIIDIDNDGNIKANRAGIAKATVKVGDKEEEVNIIVLSMTLDPVSFDYTGEECKPAVTLSSGIADHTATLGGAKITYSNNINTTTEAVAEAKFTDGGVEYSFRKNFEIKKCTLTGSEFNKEKIIVNASGEVTSITGAVYNGKPLVKDTDFTASTSNKTITSSGIAYTVTIKGIGNYEGTVSIADVKVSGKPDIATVLTAEWYDETPVLTYSDAILDSEKKKIADIKTLSSNGKEGFEAIILRYTNSFVTVSDKTGFKYEFDPLVIGTNVVKIKSDNYVGTLELTYEVDQIDVTDPSNNVTVDWKSNNVDGFIYDSTVRYESGTMYFEHSGEEICPDDYNDKNYISVKCNGTELIKGEDYDVDYDRNKDMHVSGATVYIHFKGKFNGEKTLSFKLSPNLELDAIVAFDTKSTTAKYKATPTNQWQPGYSKTYNGSNIKPTLYVAVNNNGSMAWLKSDEYEIEEVDSSYKNVGTKQLKINGKGKYAGHSITVTYEITKLNLSMVTYSLLKENKEYEYDNKAHVPVQDTDFQLTFNSFGLEEGKDYSVEITGDNKNVTTTGFKHTIVGTGNFEGKIEEVYTIKPLDLSKATGTVSINGVDTRFTVTLPVDTFEYANGEPIKPNVVVMLGDTQIMETDHYEIVYANNINVTTATSKATCTVNGKRNFTGSVKNIPFEIRALTNVNYTITLDGHSANKVSGEDNVYYCADYKPEYTGGQLMTNIRVFLGENELKYGDDYSRAGSSNTEAKTPFAEVTNASERDTKCSFYKLTFYGNLSGTVTIYFDIQQKTIEGKSVTYTPDVAFVDENTIHLPSDVVVMDGAATLVNDADYEVQPENAADLKTAGADKKFKIVGKGNYSGTINNLSFNIGTDISSLTGDVELPVTGEKATYNRTTKIFEYPYIGEQRPIVTLNGIDADKITASDYSSASTDVTGTPIEVSFEGKPETGFYGENIVKYKVVARTMTNVVAASRVSASQTGYVLELDDSVSDGRSVLSKKYDGTSANIAEATNVKLVAYENGRADYSYELLAKDINFVATSTRNNIVGPKTGTYEFKVTGKGNFTGESGKFDYLIDKISIGKDVTISAKPLTASSKFAKYNETTGFYEMYYSKSMITYEKDSNGKVREKIEFDDTDFELRITGTDTVLRKNVDWICYYPAENVINVNDPLDPSDYNTVYFVGRYNTDFYDTTTPGDNNENYGEFKFKVVAVDLATDENVTAEIEPLPYKNSEYTVAELKAKLVVKYGSEVLKEGTDYDVIVDSKKGTNTLPGEGKLTTPVSGNTGNYITIKGRDGGKYVNEKVVPIEIYLDLDSEYVEASDVSLSKSTYKVTETPSLATGIKYTANGGKATLPTSTYEVVKPDVTWPGEKEVVIRAISGSYVRGSITRTARFVDSLSANGDKYFGLNKTEFAYTGRNLGETIMAQFVQKFDPVSVPADYTISYEGNPNLSAVGSYKMVITAASDRPYFEAGTKYEIPFKIKYDLNTANKMYFEKNSTEITSAEYTGKDIVFATESIDVVAVYGVGAEATTVNLTNNGYATTSIDKVRDVGKYTITVRAVDGNDLVMGGPRDLSFEVTGKKFDATTVEVKWLENYTKDIPEFEYTRDNIKPEVVVRDKTADKLLTLGVDYTVEYERSKDVNLGKNIYSVAVVKGKGAYANSAIELKYLIKKKDISNLLTDPTMSINISPSKYLGEKVAVVPEIQILHNGDILKENTDYKLVFHDNELSSKNPSLTKPYFEVSGMGDSYEGKCTKVEFDVEKFYLDDATLRIEETEMEYTGFIKSKEQLEKDIKLYIGETQLLIGSDYYIEILGNETIQAVGEYDIQISAGNNSWCQGTKVVTYTVTPRSLAKNWNQSGDSNSKKPITITVPSVDTVKVGEANRPNEESIGIIDTGINKENKNLVLGEDFEIVGYTNDTEAGEGAYDPKKPDPYDYGYNLPKTGSPYVTIRGKGNYSDKETIDVVYNIGKNINTLPGIKAEYSPNSFYYNGGEQIPDVTVSYKDGTLKKDESFTIEVEDITDPNVPEADCVNAGPKELIIRGKGTYFGKLENKNDTNKRFTYRINPRQISKGYDLRDNRYVYTDKSSASGYTPVETKDMTLRFELKDMQKLNAESIRGLLESDQEKYRNFLGYYFKEYDNEPIEPEITVFDNGLVTADQVVGASDYTIEYVNADKTSNPPSGLMSAVKITLNGRNYNSGTSQVTFYAYYIILQKDISDTFNIVMDGGETYNWNNGSPVYPKFSVVSSGVTLKEGDYKVEYGEDIISPGTAKFKVIGQNNYTGSIEKEYTIICDITKTTAVVPKADVEFDANDPKTYDVPEAIVGTAGAQRLPTQVYKGGEAIEPDYRLILVNGAGKGKNILLTDVGDNKNYKAEISSNDNWEKSGVIAITGQQPYYGETNESKYLHFAIDLNADMLHIGNYKSVYVYNGTPIKPEFKVLTAEGQPVGDKDYIVNSVFYRKNDAGTLVETDDFVNAGTIYGAFDVKVGDLETTYTDVEYEIAPLNLGNKDKVKAIYTNNARYTGKAIHPIVTVYMLLGDGSNASKIAYLDEKDYVINWNANGQDNIYPYEGGFEIAAAADSQNFTGSTLKQFRIRPGNPVNIVTDSTSGDSLTVSWTKDIYSTGVDIELYEEGKDSPVKTKQSTGKTETFTGLKSATTYTVKLRSYLKVDIDKDGKLEPAFYGDQVVKKATTDLGETKITVTSTTKGKVSIKWVDSGDIVNYMIYRSTNKNSAGEARAWVPASSGGFTDSSLESGKTYYYYVIGYALVDGKLTPCSKQSNMETVIVK